MIKKLTAIATVCIFLLSSPAFAASCYQGNCVTDSADQVPISYSVSGKGDVTLIFVHGWSCDSRYWRQQVPYFARHFQVVTIDMAGHGNSGFARTEYTMPAFGEDIKAVVDAVGAKKVILIGHSMGGIAIAHAAVLLPEQVIGIITVDTIQNVEPMMNQEQADEMINAFKDNFRPAASDFVKSMFPKDADPKLVNWVAADMSSTPQQSALSMIRHMFNDHIAGEEAGLFEKLTVPVRCINARLWPTDEEANRRHIKSYGVTYMEGVGHFLQLEKPKEFNKKLETTLNEILKNAAPGRK